MSRHPAPFAPKERPPARSFVVGFRANEREHDVLRELASDAGMTITEFVRAALAERVRQLHQAG